MDTRVFRILQQLEMFIRHGLYRLLTSLLCYSRFEEPAKLILLFKRFIKPWQIQTITK